MINRLRSAISSQLSRPSGAGGRVIARLMNRGNRDLNSRAIDLLDVQPNSRVLDLGFGGGLTLPVLLEHADKVFAVDRAADMVEAAQTRHRDAVETGRLRVQVGGVHALPLDDGEVDRVLTVNTVYFWPDLPAALRELGRVLTPGGRLVIGIRDGAVMRRVDPAIFTVRTPAEIVEELEGVGFGESKVVTAPDGKTHLLTAIRTDRLGT